MAGLSGLCKTDNLVCQLKKDARVVLVDSPLAFKGYGRIKTGGLAEILG